MGIESTDERGRSEGFLKRFGNIPGARELMLAGGLLAQEPFLNSFGHTTEVRAAEILPHASWKEGLNMMFSAAENENYEVATYFLQTSDGKTLWVKPMSGTVGNIPEPEFEQHLQKESPGIQEFAHGKKVEVCNIHSHSKATVADALELIKKHAPLMDKESVYIARTIDLNKRLSLPPSSSDSALAFGPDDVVALVNTAGGSITTVRKDAVIDPTFVSYIEPFESHASAQSFREKLNVPPVNPVRTPALAITLAQLKWLQYVNTSDDSAEKLLLSRQYDELRATYAAVNVQLRLTDRASLEKEPPCAGARYSK